MPFFATAGTKVYIGTVTAMQNGEFDEADFTGQTWAEIGGVETLGSFGDTATPVSATHMGSARELTIKGTRNAGTMEMVCSIDYADPGQIALLAAEKTAHNYAFKVVFNDAPAGGTPSERKFVGLVMSASEQLDDANSVMRLNASVSINSNIVRTVATSSGTAPDNSVLPSITGTAQDGKTLTAAPGTWSGSPTPTYAYQWFSEGESIPGATASTYAVKTADVGNVITVIVTAKNAIGSASAISAATAIVIAA